MIFTTRALKIELQETKNPLNDFIANSLISSNSYKRKQYFIRYIGSNKEQKDYIEDLQVLATKVQEKFPFLYLSGLTYQMSYEEGQKYSQIYEDWQQANEQSLQKLYEVLFPMKFQTEMLELTEKVAFTTVMKQYRQLSPNSNATMEKSFGVKLLYWIGHYLPKLYENHEQTIPKVIFAGEIKRQELLFLHYLSLMGCDVLYMNPLEDIQAAYPECEKFSVLYKASHQYLLEIPKELAPKQEIPRNQESIKVQDRTNESRTENIKVDIRRGSINLGRSSQVTTSSTMSNSSTHYTTSASHTNPMSNYEGSRGNSNQPINVQGTSISSSNTGVRRELSYEELAQLSIAIVKIEMRDSRGDICGTGSGVVINSEGYILTNHHVIDAGCMYGVRFENDDQIYGTRQVIKYHRDYDLAIIKVDRRCKALPVYRGNQLVRGQKVVAIGSPLGLFNTISDGIISGFREFEYQQMIQFTAPTSPGSSGGALLNMYGEVIGICTAGFSRGENLNLAVDFKTIERFAGNYIG